MLNILEYASFKNEVVKHIPTFKEYKEKLLKSDIETKKLKVSDWLEALPKNDVRVKDTDYVKSLYSLLYDNDCEFLEKWFNSHLYVDKNEIDNYIYFSSFKNIRTGNVLDGKYKLSSGRLIRNLFYKQIYQNIKKKNNSNVVSTIEFIQLLYNFEIRARTFTIPAAYKYIESKNYDMLFALMRGTTNKASVFNPYTYSFILKNVLPEGKRLFCPVMSWGAPVIAVENSNYEYFVGCDVIPDVINTAKKLSEYVNESRNSLFSDEKDFRFYCHPSEKLYQLNFIDVYQDFFDTVFFSPPYYDLEMYQDGKEQSWKNYTSYNDWLSSYWEETVMLCQKVLKPGGTFSFVIVEDYKSEKLRIPISKDMDDIAQKYFVKTNLHHISWGGFSGMTQNIEKRKNLIENIHVYSKK